MNHTQFLEICEGVSVEQSEVRDEYNSRHIHVGKTGMQGEQKEESIRVGGEFIQRIYGRDAVLLLPEVVTRLKGHVTNLLDTYNEYHSIWNGIHDARIAIAIAASDAFSLQNPDDDLNPVALSQLRSSLPGTDAKYDINLAWLFYRSDQLALTIAREFNFEVPPLD